MKELKWNILIKLGAIALFFLGILNLFAKPDFLNILLGMWILIIMIFNANRKISTKKILDDTIEHMKLIFTCLIVLTFFDLIWMVLFIGSPSHAVGFSLFITFLSILAKLVLTVAVLIQKSKCEHLKETKNLQ